MNFVRKLRPSHISEWYLHRVRRDHSGFLTALTELQLPAGARVLDIGAGGFCGETTTKYLCRFHDDITAVENDPVLSHALEARYPQVKVVCADGLDFMRKTALSFDLIVIDINLDDALYSDFLPAAKNCLPPGGFIIAECIYDHGAAFNPRNPRLPLALSEPTRDFMLSRFGTAKPSLQDYQTALGTTFKSLRIIDKRINIGCGVGWLVLQAT
jgi:predicted O-methyltransferase YrrM